MASCCSGYHHCTTSSNKAWTQVLHRFKSCSWRVGDSRWWGSLTMVPAGNKAKRLLSVNHTTKTIHHHHKNEIWIKWQAFQADILRVVWRFKLTYSHRTITMQFQQFEAIWNNRKKQNQFKLFLMKSLFHVQQRKTYKKTISITRKEDLETKN